MTSTTQWRAAVQSRAATARSAKSAAGLLIAVALVVCAPATAIAQSGGSIIMFWSGSSGPVVGYDVYVSTNGSPMVYYTSVTVPHAVISGPGFQDGDALRFKVAAIDPNGARGPHSEVSDVVYFPDLPAPAGLAIVDGSGQTPTRLTWDAIPHVQSYAVYRSAVPGVTGQFAGLSSVASFDDAGADHDVLFYYSVAAIHWRQVSVFSAQIAGTFAGTVGGSPPSLSVWPRSLVFAVDAASPSASQGLTLLNGGDSEFSFAAWPTAPWVELSQTAGVVDTLPVELTVTANAGSLPAGVHQTVIELYAYHDPPDGQSPVLGPPIEVPVSITVSGANRAPIADPIPNTTIGLGSVSSIAVSALDPDAGDRIALTTTALPGFGSFVDLGNGTGRLDFAPGLADVGEYLIVVGVVDDGSPPASVTIPFRLRVRFGFGD